MYENCRDIFGRILLCLVNDSCSILCVDISIREKKKVTRDRTDTEQDIKQYLIYYPVLAIFHVF